MSFDVRTRISQLKASAKARGLNINLDLNKYQLLQTSLTPAVLENKKIDKWNGVLSSVVTGNSGGVMLNIKGQ